MCRTARRTGLVVVVSLAAYYAMPVGLIEAADGVRVAAAVLGVVALGVLFTRQLRRQFTTPSEARVRAESLLYLLVLSVLGFSFGYVVLADQFDGLRTRTDAIYFTLSTLATVGYGDVHAVGQGARIVVILQMLFNVSFVGTTAALFTSAIGRRAEARRNRQ